MSQWVFDPSQVVNVGVTVLAVFGSVARTYYRIRSEIQDLRSELTALLREKKEIHERLESDLKDHEVRLRVLEKA